MLPDAIQYRQMIVAFVEIPEAGEEVEYAVEAFVKVKVKHIAFDEAQGLMFRVVLFGVGNAVRGQVDPDHVMPQICCGCRMSAFAAGQVHDVELTPAKFVVEPLDEGTGFFGTTVPIQPVVVRTVEPRFVPLGLAIFWHIQ